MPRGLIALVSVTTALALALALAFAGVSLWLRHEQQRRLDRALLAVASHELQAARDAATASPVAPRSAALHQETSLPVYSALYDSMGVLVDSTFPPTTPTYQELPTEPGRCIDLSWQGHLLRAVRLRLPIPNQQTLLLATPWIKGEGKHARRALLALWLVAVAWAVAMAAWLVRRLLKGQQSIAVVARRVADGDLRARVDLPRHRPEIGQLGREVNEMIERLSTLVRSQQEFVACAAHELRTPLSSLLAELSNALRRPRDAAAYRTAVEEALDATRRLKQLSDELLDLAGLAGQRTVLDTTSIELSCLVRETVDLLAPIAEDKAVRVVCDTTDPGGQRSADSGSALPIEVSGRASDLGRMLRNLVENAIHHSPRGGVVSISARTRIDQQHRSVLELHIQDQGPGLPPGEEERVFEPFYRGADTQDRRGLGLGLAIARQIARAHGGDIHAEREPAAAGAHLCVTLPRARGDQRMSQPAVAAPDGRLSLSR